MAEREWDERKVSRLRYRLGLSQAEFSKRLGVRQQTVSDWETGQHTPKGASVRVLSMLAEEAARYEVRRERSRRGDANNGVPDGDTR